MHKSHFTHSAAALLLVLATAVAGCSGVEPEGTFPNRGRGDSTPYNSPSSVFGPGGLSFGGDSAKTDEGAGTGSIAVNGFLWRASLDTVAFMPMASADPFGGVIITDWYAMPEAPIRRQGRRILTARLASPGRHNGAMAKQRRRRPMLSRALHSDPRRLLETYNHSAATLNLIRAFVTGGFADLRSVHTWNQDFVRNSGVEAR